MGNSRDYWHTVCAIGILACYKRLKAEGVLALRFQSLPCFHRLRALAPKKHQAQKQPPVHPLSPHPQEMADEGVSISTSKAVKGSTKVTGEGQKAASTRGLWRPSVITQEEINPLRGGRYLPPTEVAVARSPLVKGPTGAPTSVRVPEPRSGECIIFLSHLLRGLGFQSIPFSGDCFTSMVFNFTTSPPTPFCTSPATSRSARRSFASSLTLGSG